MENILSLVGGYFLIFFLRVVDMSLDVVRFKMLARERRFIASVIAFFEIIIFLIALSLVLSGGLNDPFKIIAYAAGFATGNYVGSIIDSRLALGYLSLQVFSNYEIHEQISRTFRCEGFGVTSVNGSGRDGDIMIMFVTIKRKDLRRALKTLDEVYPEAFYSIQDAMSIHGGIFSGKKQGI